MSFVERLSSLGGALFIIHRISNESRNGSIFECSFANGAHSHHPINPIARLSLYQDCEPLPFYQTSSGLHRELKFDCWSAISFVIRFLVSSAVPSPL